VIECFQTECLVIESRRQVELVNQDTTIILRRIGSAGDISQQNSGSINRISQLELEVRGKGIIKRLPHRRIFSFGFCKKH